jgi:hypothetical protein
LKRYVKNRDRCDAWRRALPCDEWVSEKDHEKKEGRQSKLSKHRHVQGMKVPIFIIPKEITQESGGTCETDACNYGVC